MPLKHLEHDGNEDFRKEQFPDRKKQLLDLLEEEANKPDPEEELEKQQREYMRLDNPALWDGEI